MSKEILIRQFEEKDQPAVTEFITKIFVEVGWSVDPEDGVDRIAEYFHIPEKGMFWIVVDDEKMVGTAGMKFLSLGKGLIKRFYISPEHRGKGIASRLMSKLEEFGKSKKFDELVLDTDLDNQRAVIFYEKNGFTRFVPPVIQDWEQTSRPDEVFFYKKSLL